MKRILIELNQYCNLNCAYCFYNDLGRSKSVLDIGSVKRLCSKYPDVDKFFLTGGECTLSPNFSEVSEYLSARGEVIVFTNGLTVNNEAMFRNGLLFDNVDKIVLTFDSINSEYKLRGGVASDVVKAIKKLLATDNICRIEVKICVNKFNVNDFEKTLRAVVDLGIEHLSLNFIKNIKSSDNDFQLTHSEVLDVLSVASKYERYFNKEDLRLCEKSYKSNFTNHVDCIAGRGFLYVDCNGNEFFCPCLPEKFFGSNKKRDCFGEHCICIWELFK